MVEVKSLQVYFSGDLYFSALLKCIAEAKSEILVESYIFKKGVLLDRLVNALKLQAELGKEVYVLADGIGSMAEVAHLQEQFALTAVKFKSYHRFDLTTLARFIFFKLGVRKFHGGHWNKRNHRKSVIIDNNKLFFGSYNWDDCHIKSVSGKTSWRDTGAGVEMTSLEVFRQSFLLAFHSSQDSRRKFVRFKAEALNVAFLAIRLNSRFNARKRLNAELLNSLAQAKNHIFITTPYFVPPQSIVLALGQAAMRGVLVKVLIPGVTDVPIVKLASRRTVEALMNSGVHFFEYQKSLLHAKTYIIDSVGTIGSFNWNHRSFLHDLELSLSFEHQEVVAQLLQQWEIDLVHSQKLTNLSLNKLGSAQRVLSHFLYTFRHWL